MYRKSVLKNGIRVVSFEMKDRESVSLGIWCGAGGRFESDDIKGAAHFLEHVVFKGTQKYLCEQIKENIEGVGGSLNAFTSEEHTCYLAKIPARHIRKAFDVLADMVFHPNIEKKDVESERGVILEEIKMYHDLPQYFVVEELERLMWPDHALGKGLAGSFESVSKMSHTQLNEFHRNYYVSNNIVVAVCGNVPHQTVVDLVRKKTCRCEPGNEILSESVVDHQEKSRVAFFHRPIEQMHVAFGVFGLNYFDDDRHALNVLHVILGGNMSSRLFNEVREQRGLAYSIHSSVKSLLDTGLFMVRAGVDNQKLTNAMEVILNEFKKLKEDGVTQSEFKRAKEYLIGQLLLGLEDTMEHMLWVGESTITRDRIRTMEEVVRAIKGVRIADIKRVANRVFVPQQYNLAVAGPLNKAQEKHLKQLMKSAL